MKEFLEKFGLTEILSHLFPGMIALCALAVWGIPAPTALLGTELGKNDLVIGILLLIAAYAMGLVLSMWGVAGAEAAMTAPTFPPGTWKQLLGIAGPWLKWKWLEITVGIPQRQKAAMFGLMEVEDLLQRFYGVDSMPLLLQPITQLSVFRAALCDRIKEKTEAILAEPETQRRRFMFSLGVALALVLLAGSALVRSAFAILARLASQPVSRSASWRASLTVALVIALAAVTAHASNRIYAHRKEYAYTLGFTAAVCVTASVLASTLWHDSLHRVFPSFDASSLAVIVLAAVSVTLCFLLESNVPLAQVLLILFVASTLCITATALANLPLIWVRTFSVPEVPIPGLLLLAVAAYYTSRKLRTVAAQCFERELAHTLAIVRLFGHYF